jgi:hypothetical protein
MYSSHFKIQKSKDDPTEINIEVVTDKELVHPDCGVSFDAEHVFHCQRNYQGVNQVLSDLIAEGILSYDESKSKGCEHIFKHELTLGAKNFTFERVTKDITQNDNVRTLEQMLYSVCFNHNKPIHPAISPSTFFTRMYDRLMYPSFEQQIEHAKIAATTVVVLLGATAAVSIADKVLTYSAKSPRPQ